MKVCIVSDFFVPHYQGGGERRYYEILKRLVQKGHHVDLICMKIKQVKGYEKIDGINVFHIGPTIRNPPKRNLLDFFSFIFAAFIWIILRDYDLIEGQGVGLLPVSLAGMLKKAKSVAVVHDLSSGKSDQWIGLAKISGIGERVLVRLPFNRVINVSKGVKKRLVSEYGVKPKKIAVINNGVDLELIDKVKVKKKDKNSLIFVGRVIPHKHVDDLILAVSFLKDEFPDIKLKVIGTGQDLGKLKELAEDVGMTKHVKFFGMVKDYTNVIKEIKKSSIMVLPSTREGFGIVLVEAFACHVPCIAYYSDGVVAVIEDGKNGFLVKQRDAEELASKIRVLLKNKNKADKFAKHGRKKTEKHFVWDKVVDKVEEEYKKLLK